MSLVTALRPRRRSRGAHPRRATPRPVLLVGAGAQAAELEPVLRALPEGTDLVVVLRLASREDRRHGAGLAELTLRRGGRLVELRGARAAVALDAGRLHELVGDAARREVHVRGPAAFTAAARTAADHSRLSADTQVRGR